jgi:hypothetical protein
VVGGDGRLLGELLFVRVGGLLDSERDLTSTRQIRLLRRKKGVRRTTESPMRYKRPMKAQL